jgi:hypothetical protein
MNLESDIILSGKMMESSAGDNSLGLQVRTIKENGKARDFVVFEVAVLELLNLRKEETREQ